MSDSILLPRDSNQAVGLGHYALDFLAQGNPGEHSLRRVQQFHLDALACGVAAIGWGANAPRILREEASEYSQSPGATLLGSAISLAPEKAVLANCSAVRELDANGTNFGYNPRTGYMRGEFGHNDFYAVAVAGAQVARADGRRTVLAMLCLDEIRGRLAECFALKDHKLDHVLHGGIASAAVYGALLGATAAQIESAIGMLAAHFVPFRAIRHGHQLSDSKGASAAFTAELAVVCMRRAMRGFLGPADIFRNPQAVFCLFEPPLKSNESPFDLTLAIAGDDFAVRDMHFKLGLYEHQSAGAMEGLMRLLELHPALLASPDLIRRVCIAIYQPAFGIIGDPHKRDPRTRQSADHSMLYIIATLLRKACEQRRSGWAELMLLPEDYEPAALFHPLTRSFMNRIEFQHGGAEYDAKYPDGIPTSLTIHHTQLGELSSGLVMYPAGHARNPGGQLTALLEHKIRRLAAVGVFDVNAFIDRFQHLEMKSAEEIRALYDFPLLSSATSGEQVT